MDVIFNELRPQDHQEIRQLIDQGVTAEDAFPEVEQLLTKQFGLSVVARKQGKIIAVILCQCDVLKYNHYLITDPKNTNEAVCKTLANKALMKFLAKGFTNSYVHIAQQSQAQIDFWESLQWYVNQSKPIAQADNTASNTSDKEAA